MLPPARILNINSSKSRDIHGALNIKGCPIEIDLPVMIVAFIKERIKNYCFFDTQLITLPFAALSHFQVGVKSVLHWEQVNGLGIGGVTASRFSILLTHSSNPVK